jgi:hypothetical protein
MGAISEEALIFRQISTWKLDSFSSNGFIWRSFYFKISAIVALNLV